MSSLLENLCKVPALVEILNHPHLKKEIFCSPINGNNYKERDVDLQRAVSEFLNDFPHVLKRLTPKHLIILISFEMRKWAEYQNQYFGLSFEFSQNFIRSSFFTSKGLIDEEKAARKLLMEPSLSSFLKYSIACQYFLEDIIPSLWQVLQKETNFEKMLKEHKSRIPMELWSNYLEKKKSASTLDQNVITRTFRISVFSYGLNHQNIEAVKFSLGSKGGSKEDKTEDKIVRELVYKFFWDYAWPILKKVEHCTLPSSLFLTHYLDGRNIILYFISLMNKRELKEFFLKFDNSYKIFKLFLLWPYQNQFMNFAYIIFDNFSALEYNKLMAQIIWLLDDKHVCESYNYRMLLRELWIKSPPYMKEEVISLESYPSFHKNLIEMLFKLKNFTSDDLDNINLILEYANSLDRINILLYQGKSIFRSIIFSHDNVELAHLFLKNFDLNQESLQTFKKDFTFDSIIDIMEKQDLNLVDKIFKWVVGSDDIDDFKEEMLQRWTRFNKIEHFFVDLKEEAPFSFLNKIMKWFLKTDEKIEEWKMNIEYSPLITYSDYLWFDRLSKYRGHSHEELLAIKREVLFGNLPDIARGFLDDENARECLDSNVFYLCSDEKEKLEEFTDHLRSFYEDSIKQKMCLLCLNNNHVLGDGGEVQLLCENHGTNGFITLDGVDGICSILKQIDSSLRWTVHCEHCM